MQRRQPFIFLATIITAFTLLVATTLPAAAAAPAKKTTQAVTAKININNADVETLTTLPGIGSKTADSIITYRKANGKFKSVDDLLNIKGIGEKKLKKMKPFLKI